MLRGESSLGTSSALVFSYLTRFFSFFLQCEALSKAKENFDSDQSYEKGVQGYNKNSYDSASLLPQSNDVIRRIYTLITFWASRRK